MNDTNYWLWLQYGVGYAGNIKQQLEYFKTPKAIYDSTSDELINGGFSATVIKRLNQKSPLSFDETVDFCAEHSLKIITPDSEFYPKKLLEIENFPIVLYVRGDYTCLANGFNIAVIGSRTPCAYGEAAAREIVSVLAKNSATIVSGGALGLDSISHMEAMENSGKTILVMGCGHGTKYLMENSQLRKQVTMHGAVISEYPPFTPVGPGTFPQRNRIISAMCEGVVIIEARMGSGTFSTAKHAKSHGRKLFVLPGDIKSGKFDGSNMLINEGAIPVFSGADVLKSFKGRSFSTVFKSHNENESFQGLNDDASSSKKKRSTKKDKTTSAKPKTLEKKKNIPKKVPEGISKNAQIVYNIMSDDVCFLDEITRASGLEVRKVLAALTELEMFGAISATAPNKYELNYE